MCVCAGWGKKSSLGLAQFSSEMAERVCFLPSFLPSFSNGLFVHPFGADGGGGVVQIAEYNCFQRKAYKLRCLVLGRELICAAQHLL